MSMFDELLRNDSRVAENMLRRGLLTQEEYQRQQKNLPDCADNAEYIAAYEEPAAEGSGDAPTFEAV